MSQSKTELTVCCVMLTADRPHLARRAVESFRSQTYPAKQLLIWDNGAEMQPDLEAEDDGIYWVSATRQTVGGLRNNVNCFWTEFPILIHCPASLRAAKQLNREFPILIHWDSDDYSHPNRIAEQVELLQSSGADCVGYREMLFWKQPDGEAWLYSNRDPRYCLGTSLCYWRKTWERKPFEATSQGEDHLFTLGLKCVSVTSIFDVHNDPYIDVLPTGEADKTPRMIARIHAGNTSNAYDPGVMRKSAEWKRVPEWDEYCRGVME